MTLQQFSERPTPSGTCQLGLTDLLQSNDLSGIDQAQGKLSVQRETDKSVCCVTDT
jgi:hypothetical protein